MIVVLSSHIPYHIRHSPCQMIQIMTVVEPIARIIRHKLDGSPAHASTDNNSIFFQSRPMATTCSHHLKEMSVRHLTDGMGHHAVIGIFESHPLTRFDAKIFGIGIDLAIAKIDIGYCSIKFTFPQGAISNSSRRCQ